ncbi:MAG: IPT/TIG domain-containing protein, partial [Flammeovirgaceae bacterium]|nr:IPT/TIG domain-containing protein [Flammeovirgaceae bacterium]
KQPRDIAFTKDGKIFYVSSFGENAVTVIRNKIPDLEDVSPKVVQIGDSMAISGLNMGSDQESRELFVGGEKVNEIYSWSDTVIVCAVPEVPAGDQTISLKVGYYTDEMENKIKVSKSPAPEITDFNPKKGKSEDTITITGYHFGKDKEDVVVNFGTAAVEVIDYSPNTLKILSPVLPDGDYFITVKVFMQEVKSNEVFELNNSNPIAQIYYFDSKRNFKKADPDIKIKADDSLLVQIKFDKPIVSTAEVMLAFSGESQQGEIKANRISSETYEAIYVGESGEGEVLLSINGAIGENGLQSLSNPGKGSSFFLDNTAPVLKYISLQNGEVDFKIDSVITINFSEAIYHEGNLIDHSEALNEHLFFKEKISEKPIPFEVFGTSSISPINPLKYNIEYQIGIIGELTDLAGNPLEHEVLNFTTEEIPPTIEFGPAVARAGDWIYLKVHNLTADSINGIQLDDDTIPTQNIQWFSNDSVSIIIPELLDGEKYVTVLTTKRERIYASQKLVIKTRKLQITSISHPDFIYSGRDNKAIITVDSIEWVKSCQFIYRGIARQQWEKKVLSPSKNGFLAELDTTVDPIGVEYYFKLEILGGEPISTNNVFVNNFHESGLSVKVLKAGNKFEDYQTISIPLQLDYPRVEAVFAPLGNYNKENWRMFSAHSDGISFTEYKDGFSNIELGRGYYLIFREAAKFQTGPGKTVSVRPDEPYIILLKRGWNLIGNPYPYNVSLDSIKNLNNLTNGKIEFYGFFNGFKTNPDLLERFGNLLIFVHENAPLSLKIPVFFDPKANSRISKQTDTEEELTWKIDFFDGENLLSSLGMSPVGKRSRDRLDRMAVPKGLENIKLVSSGKSYFYPYFSKDIVNDTASAEWQLKFSTPDLTTYQLTYEIADLPEGKQLFYYHKPTGSFTQLNPEKGVLKLTLADGKADFSIFYGDSHSVSEFYSKAYIGEVYPNPANGIFYFDVSAEKKSSIRFMLYTQEGILIVQKDYLGVDKGYHQTEISGLALPPGLYYYSLQLNEHNEFIRTGKIFVR